MSADTIPEETTDNVLGSKLIDGIRVPIIFDVEIFSSALNYKAKPEDIFLAAYPKSGATWMETILFGLMNNGQAFDENMSEYLARTPYLELIGERGINNMHRPCVIKSHLPLNRIPYHENAKYICVIRKPKDVCVSYYHFVQNLFGQASDDDIFPKFFEYFINGKAFYGDYFEHLRIVWQRRHDPNVFVTSYEEMKYDLRSVVTKLAQFLDISYDDHIIDRVVKYSSFEYMKERFDKAYAQEALITLTNESPTAPWPIDKRSLKQASQRVLIRKGVVDGWSSIMTEEQAQRLDQIFAEKTADMPGLDKLFNRT